MIALLRGPYARSLANRQRILALIRQEPGITKAEVCRATGLGWGTVSHHVRTLVGSGAALAHRSARRVYLYPPSVMSSHMFWMRLLRQPIPRRILEELRAGPSRVPAMSERLGIPRTTVRRHLSEMEGAGILERVDGGFAIRGERLDAGDRPGPHEPGPASPPDVA